MAYSEIDPITGKRKKSGAVWPGHQIAPLALVMRQWRRSTKHWPQWATTP
jgi:hypothetical protein